MKKFTCFLLSLLMVLTMLPTLAFAQDTALVPQDMANTPAPPARALEGNQLPLTGYFKANLKGDYANREVRIYITETATVRPYYHLIAVPNGVDPDQFIIDSGWKQLADETGECLYVLMPDAATRTWGDAEDEIGYIKAAHSYHSGMGSYFTTFGLFYVVGYAEACKALEGWAAINPQLVISQAYINGESYGLDMLKALGATSYGFKHMTDGDIKDQDNDGTVERTDANGNQKILKQMAARWASILNPDKGEEAGLLTKGDMPVPTWLFNYKTADSLTYWKQVNRATGETPDESLSVFGIINAKLDVFGQKEDTWATDYSGKISKVVSGTTAFDPCNYAFTRSLRNEMVLYTRYDSTISYGNSLTYRIDYSAIQTERFNNPYRTASGTVTGIGLDGAPVKGELSLTGVFVDYNYPSDVLLYVPETAPEKDIPVVMVWHGGSQTDHLFFDSTCWWQTAAKEGFALILPNRTVHGVERTVRIHDRGLFDTMYKMLEDDGRFDMSRIYLTGQSQGGASTCNMTLDHPSKVAAAAPTNVIADGSELNPKPQPAPVPINLFVGEGNYSYRGIPGFTNDTSYPEDESTGLTRSTKAAEAGVDVFWDAFTPMQKYIDLFCTLNGVDDSNLSDKIAYSGATANNCGENNPEGSLADWNTNNARFRTFKWLNEDEIPVVEYTFCLAQAHNCLTGYRPEIWDFLKHYSVETAEDGTTTHYYSASAFAEDDKVAINF